MLLTWKLVHTFGFIAWFAGLLATTTAQVVARKAPDAGARRTAWSLMRRYVPLEIVGMIATPIGGLLTTWAKYGSFFPKGVIFVHIKLLLVILAVIGNGVLLAQRKKATPLLESGGAPWNSALKRIAMVQGITTLMLPLAVIVVLWFLYG